MPCLLELQREQAGTILAILVEPPLEIGIKWSAVMLSEELQYAQLWAKAFKTMIHSFADKEILPPLALRLALAFIFATLPAGDWRYRLSCAALYSRYSGLLARRLAKYFLLRTRSFSFAAGVCLYILFLCACHLAGSIPVGHLEYFLGLVAMQ